MPVETDDTAFVTSTQGFLIFADKGLNTVYLFGKEGLLTRIRIHRRRWRAVRRDAGSDDRHHHSHRDRSLKSRRDDVRRIHPSKTWILITALAAGGQAATFARMSTTTVTVPTKTRRSKSRVALGGAASERFVGGCARRYLPRACAIRTRLASPVLRLTAEQFCCVYRFLFRPQALARIDSSLTVKSSSDNSRLV